MDFIQDWWVKVEPFRLKSKINGVELQAKRFIPRDTFCAFYCVNPAVFSGKWLEAFRTISLDGVEEACVSGHPLAKMFVLPFEKRGSQVKPISKAMWKVFLDCNILSPKLEKLFGRLQANRSYYQKLTGKAQAWLGSLKSLKERTRKLVRESKNFESFSAYINSSNSNVELLLELMELLVQSIEIFEGARQVGIQINNNFREKFTWNEGASPISLADAYTMNEYADYAIGIVENDEESPFISPNNLLPVWWGLNKDTCSTKAMPPFAGKYRPVTAMFSNEPSSESFGPNADCTWEEFAIQGGYEETKKGTYQDFVEAAVNPKMILKTTQDVGPGEPIVWCYGRGDESYAVHESCKNSGIGKNAAATPYFKHLNWAIHACEFLNVNRSFGEARYTRKLDTVGLVKIAYMEADGVELLDHERDELSIMHRRTPKSTVWKIGIFGYTFNKKN